MSDRVLSRTTRPWLPAAEVGLAGAFVLLDLAIPAILIAVLAAMSLAVRREGVASLGLRRPRRGHVVVGAATFAVLWSVFQLSVTMPLAIRLSGRRPDLGVFEDVEGNLGLLGVLVVLSWVLGALVEEVAFRGFLLTRLREVLGRNGAGLVLSIAVSSLLFGLLHSEQGPVGVVVVGLDAGAFCLLRLHWGTVWAPVLAHGVNNTLGLLGFFLVGPVYGLW